MEFEALSQILALIGPNWLAASLSGNMLVPGWIRVPSLGLQFWGVKLSDEQLQDFLGGGFNFFLCSLLFGEDYHFDSYLSNGFETTN